MTEPHLCLKERKNACDTNFLVIASSLQISIPTGHMGFQAIKMGIGFVPLSSIIVPSVPF